MLQQFQYSQCSIYCVKGLQYTVFTNYSVGTKGIVGDCEWLSGGRDGMQGAWGRRCQLRQSI